jgi:choline dehydrogenase-like flavoprotein
VIESSVSNYSRNGRQHTELADKEVIVTSSPVGSPKLLLLSGVGPAEELREVGVPCVHHLPGVGKNFHDHIDIGSIFESKTNRIQDLLSRGVFGSPVKAGQGMSFQRKGVSVLG